MRRKLKEVHKKPFSGKALREKYSLTQAEYRTIYHRWKRSVKRGLKQDLEFYIQNPAYTRQKKGKPKRYFYERRRMLLALAMPKWVDINSLAMFYAACPEGYHVDHIIPLRGENVSGLHVLWNLQYLPRKENLDKSNKLASE